MPDNALRIITQYIERTFSDGLALNTSETQRDHRSFMIGAARHRGLGIKNLGRDHIAFLDEGRAIAGMYKNVTSLVSHAALSVANSKKLTRELYTQAGLPIPAERSFARDHFDEALEYFEHRQGPFVVKPAAAKTSVATHVHTTAQFRQAWSRAVTAARPKHRVVVEELVSGLNIRAFVVEDRVVASVVRLPPFVIGNGTDSLSTLIEAKTALRAGHPYLQRMPIQVDTTVLAQQNITYTSVPSDGEVVLLNESVSLYDGGEPMDVTHDVHPELQQLAIQSAHAIPGMTVAGINLIVKDPTVPDDAVVLQPNVAANIALHHAPAYGKSVDVAGAIVTQMMRNSPRPPKSDRRSGGTRVSTWKTRTKQIGNRIGESFNPPPRTAY